MPDPSSLLIFSEDEARPLEAYNRFVGTLPPELQQQLRAVLMSYLGAYGPVETLERFRGRTLAQVLEDYHPPSEPPVVKSGELDGVRYTLDDRPGSGGNPASS